jgi:hypothetical protein
LAGCKVDPDASQQYKQLVTHWKWSYPHIEDDLKDAFKSIAQDIRSKNAWRVQAGDRVEVYKYRQNSKDIKRGAKYGLRIIGLLDKATNMMYPILVWPKTEWSDADENTLSKAIEEIQKILGYCIISGCDGALQPKDPVVVDENDGSVQVQCNKCGATVWKSA